MFAAAATIITTAARNDVWQIKQCKLLAREYSVEKSPSFSASQRANNEKLTNYVMGSDLRRTVVAFLGLQIAMAKVSGHGSDGSSVGRRYEHKTDPSHSSRASAGH